jgi:hypothetical protein
MWEKTHEDDRGVWNNYRNVLTGENSIKEHKPKVVWRSCKNFKDHYFEQTGNREWTCTKCQFIFLPIIGIHKLEDGKVIETPPPPIK